MAKSVPLRLEEQLCFAVYSASRALTRAYAPLLSPLGLTYPQYLVLLVLWEQDGESISQLGERLGLDSGTLTPLLKRLEARQLVARGRDLQDERMVRVHLTPAGRALQKRAKEVPSALACKAGFDAADGRSLARLVKLREELRGLVRVLEDGERAAG
jgi:MarR family transcriptional regulator, organic hydroperoxide resistance regulator